MAEPRPAAEGADVGGMASTADAGLDRATRRSSESAEAGPVGTATPGTAPGAAGGNASGDAGNAGNAGDARADARAAARRGDAWQDDDEDGARHPPVAPVDEGPLESLGKSVGEALTGSVDDAVPRKGPG